MKHPQKKFSIKIGVWPRLILLAVAIALLGIAPRPQAFRRSLGLARFSIDAGLPLQASKALADAARQAPDRPDLWEQAGVYALQAGDVDLAAGDLEQARQADALTGDGWIALGDAYRRQEKLPEAVAAWTDGIERYGVSPDALDRLWQAHLQMGNLDQALADLRSLLVLDPDDALLNDRLGLLLVVQNPEEALSYLDKAAQLDATYQAAASDIRRAWLSARIDGNVAFTQLSVGRVLAALGEWDLSIQSFQRAVAERPDYAEAWAYLGEARQHAGTGTLQIDQAAQSDGLIELQNALALDPASLSAHTFLALYWTRKADYTQALVMIQDTVAMDPQNPALQVQYASIQAASGDVAGAYATYLHAIDLSPYEPAYRRYLVQFALDYNYELEKLALPVARQLVADSPQDAASLDLMAQLMIKLNDLDSAERFLERALASDPHNAAAHLHLGLVFALKDSRQESYNELKLAISLAPNAPIAAQAQRLLETYFP